MVAAQDLVDSTFDIVVPDPGQPLRARVIHPDNLALQQKANAYLSLKLPERKVKKLERHLKGLTAELDKVGWTSIDLKYQAAATRWHEIMARRKEILDLRSSVDEAALAALAVEWKDLRHELDRLKHDSETIALKYRDYVPVARKATAIQQKLNEHKAAVDRELAYKKARDKLVQESHDWHDIIQQALTGIGLCYRYSKNGKEYTQRVKIAQIHAGLDAVYLKIHATSKSLFGWRWALPRNVNPQQLVSEETLKTLEMATERQVEAISEKHNGVWYRINRLGVSDGIIEKVTYQQVMSTYGQANHEAIPIPLGVMQGLDVCWAELAKYPHILIAGSSGSGKSNLVNGIISTIISQQTPDTVRLLLVDLKEGVEFSVYEDNAVPHLIGSCITTPPALLDALTQLELLRIERSKRLGSVYAKSIDEYNQRVPEAERMARITVIIDEFSAIYMSNPFQDERENMRVATQIKALVRQLLAKARAAGIQLVICTQSPYVEILPGIDKANIALKICGRFLDKNVSRAILGNGAAAEIPEKCPGRMIVQTAGRAFLVQTPLISQQDLMDAIKSSQLHPDGKVIQMPALPEGAPASQPVSKDEVIAVSLKHFGGKLPYKRMFDEFFREDGRISIRRLETIVKRIVDDGSVTYQGQVYNIVKVRGGGPALKLHTEHTPASVEISA